MLGLEKRNPLLWIQIEGMKMCTEVHSCDVYLETLSSLGTAFTQLSAGYIRTGVLERGPLSSLPSNMWRAGETEGFWTMEERWQAKRSSWDIKVGTVMLWGRNKIVWKRATKIEDFRGGAFMVDDLGYNHVFASWTVERICHWCWRRQTTLKQRCWIDHFHEWSIPQYRRMARVEEES